MKEQSIAVYPSAVPEAAVPATNIQPLQSKSNQSSYINTTYNYTISYPKGYFVLGLGFEPATSISQAVTIMKGSQDDINKLTSGNNLEKHYYDSFSIFPQNGLCREINYGTPTKSAIKVDNLDGAMWIGDSSTFADPYWGDILIHVEKDSKCYKFSFLRDPNNKEKSEVLLNQFISDFKFSN